MRHLLLATVTVLFAACSPKSRFKDYTTPERAARSFVEAGRVGDMESFRESVVAAERGQNLTCDDEDLGDYELMLDRRIGDDRAIVMMQLGPVQSPLACVREDHLPH